MKGLAILALTVIFSFPVSAKTQDEGLCDALGDLVSTIYDKRFNGVDKGEMIGAVIKSRMSDSLKIATIKYINTAYSMRVPVTKKERTQFISDAKDTVYNTCMNKGE